MKIKVTLFALLLVTTLLLVACGGAESRTETPAAPAAVQITGDVAMKDDTMAERADDDAMMDDAGDAAMGDAGDAMAEETPDDAMTDDAGDAMAEETPDDAMMDDAGDAMAEETPDDAMTDDAGDAMAEETPDDAMMDDAGDAMAEETPDDAMTDDAGDAMTANEAAAMNLPAWFTAELTDVNSGQAFTIADQKGRIVLVETLAVWCSNCLRQQKEIKALHEALGERDDLVSVGLDIDLNESAQQLKNHADRNGFDWIYAVATPEVARDIAQLYGNLFLNPPSTPMLIVDREGQVHPLPFGIKSAGDLQAALAPFLS